MKAVADTMQFFSLRYSLPGLTCDIADHHEPSDRGQVDGVASPVLYLGDALFSQNGATGCLWLSPTKSVQPGDGARLIRAQRKIIGRRSRPAKRG